MKFKRVYLLIVIFLVLLLGLVGVLKKELFFPAINESVKTPSNETEVVAPSKTLKKMLSIAGVVREIDLANKTFTLKVTGDSSGNKEYKVTVDSNTKIFASSTTITKGKTTSPKNVSFQDIKPNNFVIIESNVDLASLKEFSATVIQIITEPVIETKGK